MRKRTVLFTLRSDDPIVLAKLHKEVYKGSTKLHTDGVLEGLSFALPVTTHDEYQACIGHAENIIASGMSLLLHIEARTILDTTKENENGLTPAEFFNNHMSYRFHVIIKEWPAITKELLRELKPYFSTDPLRLFGPDPSDWYMPIASTQAQLHEMIEVLKAHEIQAKISQHYYFGGMREDCIVRTHQYARLTERDVVRRFQLNLSVKGLDDTGTWTYDGQSTTTGIVKMLRALDSETFPL